MRLPCGRGRGCNWIQNTVYRQRVPPPLRSGRLLPEEHLTGVCTKTLIRVGLSTLALALTSCTTAGSARSTPGTPTPLSYGVPTSADVPIAYGKPLHAASEGREDPTGTGLAFLLDSGSRSVYEFDVARR